MINIWAERYLPAFKPYILFSCIASDVAHKYVKFGVLIFIFVSTWLQSLMTTFIVVSVAFPTHWSTSTAPCLLPTPLGSLLSAKYLSPCLLCYFFYFELKFTDTLDFSYKGNYAICKLVCLPYFMSRLVSRDTHFTTGNSDLSCLTAECCSTTVYQYYTSFGTHLWMHTETASKG